MFLQLFWPSTVLYLHLYNLFAMISGESLNLTSYLLGNYFQDFLKYNESRVQQLPCKISDPIPLGEGVGVGWMKGVDSMAMPEGSTLYDLIQTGVTHTHAAVGVLVRLRKELSLVKDIPVLLAIDQVIQTTSFNIPFCVVLCIRVAYCLPLLVSAV